MEVGAIGFHDNSKERHPNLAELQEIRGAEFRADAKRERIEKLNAEKMERRERELAAQQRSYASVMDPSNMRSNKDFEAAVDDSVAKGFEEDFM
eukprot:gene31586-41013_t